MTPTKVWRLRLLGYVGVNFNGLLVPLLIYSFTQSTLLAGLSLLVEWAPKLGFYLAGGALSAKLSCRRAHVGLEAARLLAFLAMLGVALRLLPWQVLMVSAALYQATNAISNIIFENLVTAWWPDELRTAGHSRIMRADIEAGILATGLGIMVDDTLTLLAAGLVVQGFTLALACRWRNTLHVDAPRGHLSLRTLLGDTLRAMRHIDSRLLRLSAISLTVGLPAAALFSALPFFLASSFPTIEVGPRELAMVALGRSLLTLGMVHLLNPFLAKQQTASRFAIGGASLALLGGGLCALTGGYGALLGLLLTSWAGYLYNPWARTRRQEWLPENPELRLPMTGVLISVEACSYLIGAVLIASCQQDMALLAMLVTAPMLGGLILARPWLKIHA